MTNLKKQVESILFSVGRKISVAEIARLLRKKEPEQVIEALKELQEDYERKEDSSLVIVQDGGFWKFTVKSEFMSVVENLVTKTELTKTVMETLAVIAYKAPILQSEMIRIRTNKAYDHLKELEELGYITRSPRGRTKMIKLGERFFDYFDVPQSELRSKFAKVQEMEDFIKGKESEMQQDAKKLSAQKLMIKEQEERIKKQTAEEIERLDEEIAKLPPLETYDSVETYDVPSFEDQPSGLEKEKLGDLEVVETAVFEQVPLAEAAPKELSGGQVTPPREPSQSGEEEVKEAAKQDKPLPPVPGLYEGGMPEELQKRVDKRVKELLEGEPGDKA